jgi:RNA polymerase sigma-70 factor (ECF subfamily)
VTAGGEPSNDQFRALFSAHVRAIEAYVAGHYPGADGDDIVSETFGVAWRRWSEMPVGAERPWLIGVARHLIRNTVRSARRRTVFVEALAAFRPPVTTDLAGDGMLAEDLEAMRSAFAELSGVDQEILLLAAWEDLRGAELASVLGITADQASVRLHRARRRLRERTLAEGSAR